MANLVLHPEVGSEWDPSLLTEDAVSAWWQNLSAAERRALDSSLTVRAAPNPGPQTDAFLCEADELGFGGAASGGKALDNDARVITPRGTKRHGDLVVGDVLCAVDGGLTAIISTQAHENEPCFKLTFSDGTSTICGAEHLWLAWRVGDKQYWPRHPKANRWGYVAGRHTAKVLTAETIRRACERGERYRVPLCAPVAGLDAPPGLDPYALGALLGGGCLTANDVTLDVNREDVAVLEHVAAVLEGFNFHALPTTPNRIRGRLPTGCPAHTVLNALGLLGRRSWERFLPEGVQSSPVEWRWALLQGLMDTDGSIDRERCAYFITASPQLRDGACALARSLGCFVTITEKVGEEEPAGVYEQHRPSWRLRIRSYEPTRLFRLLRKQNLAEDITHHVHGKAIANIEDAGTREASCIQVDHPTGLYLTEDYTVTHNSALGALLALNSHRRSLFIRADGAQLRQLIDDCVEFAGTDVGLNRQQGVFRLLHSYGDNGMPIFRVLEFLGIGKPDEEQKLRGRAHDLKFYDECTEYPLSKILFIQQWNRSPYKGQRVRCVMGFNPPQDAKSQWLMDHFAAWVDDRHENPAKPGELRWFYRNEEDQEVELLTPDPVLLHLHGETLTVKPISRTFIPARVTDNPHRDPQYEARLLGMPQEQRDALYFGIFKRNIRDNPFQVLPTLWVEAAMDRWDPSGESGPMDAVGIDVARGGQHKSVYARRHAWWWNKLLRYPGKETPDGYAVAAYFVQCRRGNADACIDANGVGASPADILMKTYPTFPITGQTRVGIPRIEQLLKMYNLRTALYWLLRKLLDPGNNMLVALPRDKRLRTELTAPKYEIRGDVVQVQLKEQVVEDLGFSPDDADSVVTSLANVFVRRPPGIEKLVWQYRKRRGAEEFVHAQNARYKNGSRRPGGWQSR